MFSLLQLLRANSNIQSWLESTVKDACMMLIRHAQLEKTLDLIGRNLSRRSNSKRMASTLTHEWSTSESIEDATKLSATYDYDINQLMADNDDRNLELDELRRKFQYCMIITDNGTRESEVTTSKLAAILVSYFLHSL